MKFVILTLLILSNFPIYAQVCTACDRHCFDFYDNSWGIMAGSMKKASNFEINISMDKKDYLSLEPIWLTVKVKNNSNHTDSLEYLNDIELLQSLNVKDAKEKKLPYHGVMVDYAIPFFAKYGPYEELTYNIEINEGYGNVKLDNRPIAYVPNSYFDDGQYTVSSFWNREPETFFSNQLSFNVSSPGGSDFEVFNKLLDIYQSHGERFINYTYKANQLKNIYAQYPQSVYAEQAFNDYSEIVTYPFDNFKTNFIDECVGFFQRYPDSYYSHKVLVNCVKAFVKINGKDKAKLISFLEEIKQQFPSSKIGESAQKLLQDNEYIKKILNKKSGKKS